MSKADELYYQYRRKLNQENNTRQGYRREKSAGQGTRNERYINEVLGGQGTPVQRPQTSTPASGPKTREQILQEYRSGFSQPAQPARPAPAQRINPFDSITYQNPAVQAFHEQTGWMDPTTKALWDIANQSVGKKSNASPDTLHAMGGLQFATQNFRQTGDTVNKNKYKQMMDNAPDSGQGLRSSTPQKTAEIAKQADQRRDSQKAQRQAEDLFRTIGNPNATVGGAIRPAPTGSQGNVDRYGRRISPLSQRAEEEYYSTDPLRRLAFENIAKDDPDNPMNDTREIGNDALIRSHMTGEEKAVYNHLYASRGPAAAKEYQNGLMDLINQRIGEQNYEENFKNAPTATKALYTFGSNFRGGLEGIANFPAAMAGVDNRQARSAADYTSAAIRGDESNNGAQNVLYDALSSAGRMAPGVIASMATGIPQLGNAVFAASAGGNAYSEAMGSGESTSTARVYAGQQFVDEEVTNWLLGGVNFFGGGALRQLMANTPAGQMVGNAIDNAVRTETGRRLVKSLLAYLGDMAGEAQQEYLQFYTENFTKALLGMKDENGNPTQFNTNLLDPDAWYAAALGALNAGAMNLPGGVSRIVRGTTADVSDARQMADVLAETPRDAFVSNEVYEAAQEMQKVAEAVAVKVESGQEASAADKLAYSEALADFLTTANEAEEEAITDNTTASSTDTDTQSTEATAPTTETTAPTTETTEATTPSTTDVDAAEAERRRKAQEWFDEIDAFINEDQEPVPPEPIAQVEEAVPSINENADNINAEVDARRQQTEANRDRLREIYQGIPAPVTTSQQEETRTPTTTELLQEIANTEFEAPAVDQSDIDSRAGAYPDDAAAVYKKYANNINDIVSYDENMRKAYESGAKGVELVSLVEEDDRFGDFYFEHQDAIDDMFRAGRKTWTQRGQKATIETMQAPAETQQNTPAPLNPAPVGSKIESGKKFKVKDGDIQVAANRIFKDARQRSGAPTGSLIGKDGRQYFTDGTMAVVLNQQVKGVGVQSENAAKYIDVMNKALENARAQKDGMSADYSSFHKAIGSMSNTNMTEYNGKKLFSFDGNQLFDFGPSAQMVNARKMETALRMIENSEVYYSNSIKTPIYIKGDNGEAIVFGLNYPKAKQFLYGKEQSQETQQQEQKAPLKEENNGRLGDAGTGNGSSQGRVVPVGRGAETDGSEGAGEARPVTGRGVGENGRSEQGESKPRTGRDTGASESVTEEKPADKLPPEAKEKIEEGVPETAATTADERPAETQAEIESKRAADIQPKGTNFVIPPEGLKLPNGEKARYKANVAAIQTLRTLMEDNRQATPEEQAVLSQYVGWGGLKSVFDEKNDKWKKEYKQLQELLSKEEYETAKGSVLNAHYTEVGVIRAIYNGLKGMGFKGGRIMEPAAGVGHFAGAMPSDINVQSLTMVELDNITGNIAKYLYPNADVRVQGFEKAVLPDNYMDLAISNVPFGNYSIFDKAYPKSVTSAIHNYFFAKSLDKVRPGGLVCFITSRYTMDAKDSSVRDYIMQRADLVGAIRLPDTAFKGNAGTDVVTDIIVLKKREAGTPYSGEAFKNTDYYHSGLKIWDQTNEYFQNHPEMVLGEASASGTMYRSNSLTYKAKPGNLSKQIEKAFSNITAKMDYPAKQSDTDTFRENRNAIRKANGNSKNGSYVKENGKIYKNDNGNLVEADLDTKKAKIVSASIDLRDTARQLLNLQLNHGDEAEINRLRGKLNTVYDSFVKEYGPLNKTSNRSIISGDSDSPFIFALENYNAETKTATKSDMFTKNTVSPRKIVEHVDNMEDGLAASLNDSGTVDVSLIARVTGKSEEDTTRELIDQKLAFKTKDGGLQSAQQYLAGNVRAKLKEARALAMIDKDFKNNVEELERVVPKDIEPADISVKPGATWIPPDLYADFAAEMLGTKNNGWRKDITVTYVPQAGVYKVEYGSSNAWALKRNSYSVSEYGTDKKTFVEIFEAALNNKDLKVYFPHGKDEKAVLDQKSTIAVKEKKRIIIQKFQEWMWSDKDRVKTYAPLYNDIFNNSAIPNYDGSKLQIEGLSSKISLREHQASAVQRIIMSGGNTLLAHGTGSGKTLEMAAAAMKLRQIGAVKKPMFVVPKNILGQWGNEFYSYFPNAKILLPGENDFTPARRKAFINKVTTGDWDAVIVSYEQFYKIPMSRDAQKAFYQNQIDEILAAQQAARETEGKKGFTVSALEKKRKQLQTKLEYLDSGARDDDNINFESLGVDSLFVDEAHNFKNLYYNTQLQNVSDLGNQTGSERAFDLYSKVRYLQSVNGGRGIVFATATPVMNSVVEMYTMQRYLQGDLLEQKGINNFDAWVNEFGDVQEVQKIKSDGGGYETRTSLARYRNLAELQQMFRGFADVVTNPPGLADKLPKLRGGAPTVVECDPTEAQRAYLKELGKRSEAVRHSRDLKEDNILKIYSDGKKMSYTQRMIDSSLPYEEGGKILESVSRILKEYKASSKTKGVQLVFCDTGVIGSNAKNPLSLWTDIRDLLVQGGIPENEIDFARSGMTDKQKEAMMKKANDGTTRVLIGSTKTMGTGLNVQKRLIGMHEINCPDRPGDVDQNRGRLIRQGNTNKEVFIYTYITKETFDSRQWDNQKRKSAFIHQAIAGDINGRTADGDGEFSMSAAEISAIASGNPLIMEQNEVSTKIRNFEALESDYTKRMTSARRKLSELPRQIEQIQHNIKTYEDDAARVPDLSGENFAITVGKITYTKRSDAGQAIIDEARKFFSLTEESAVKKIGKVGDYDLLVTNRGGGILSLNGQYEFNVSMATGANDIADSPAGTIQSLANAAKMPGKRLQAARIALDEANKELSRYKEIAKQKFEHADELNRLRNREAEIMEELNPSREQGMPVAEDGVQNMVSSGTIQNMNAASSAPSYVSQWEATRVGDADKAPMSLSDLIGKIRHDLGLSITSGNIRGNRSRGQYNTHDKGIRTKIANDLPPLAHEVGHYFDQKYSIISGKLDTVVKNELEAALKKDLGPDADKYKKDQRESEGFAEYVRQYMQNREEASIAYPNLTAHLKSKLSARDLAEFNNIADEINAYYSLDAENAQSAIRLREEGGRDFRTIGEKIRDMGDDLYQTWVDSNHSIKRFDDATGGHAYKLASNAAYSDAIAGQLIVGDLTDMNGQYVGPGLKTALHGIDLTDRKTYVAFNEYLVCRHGQTWLADGKRVFADDRKNSIAFMQRRVSELESQYENFKEAADRLVDFVQKFTQTWGVNTGLISQETLDAWNEKYPDYVPLYRMMEKGTPGARRGFANQNSPYKRAKGSGLDIMAPVDGIMDQIVRVTNTALRNNVMLEMRRAYKNSPNADANFISPVPAPLRPKTFDMTGTKAQLAGDIKDALIGGKIKMDLGSALELTSIIDSINDTMLQFEKGRAKDNVVTILVNGEKEYWQVNDKKLLESIGNMNPTKIGGLLEAYANTTRFLTANITGNNPIWSIFSNAPRDLGTFLVYSKSNKDKLSQVSKIGSGWMNSVNANLRDGKNVDPLYAEYLAMGGGWTSAYSADTDLAKKARKKITSNKAARTMDTMNPLNWVSFMTDTIEQGPRFATYKLMRESGLSPQEAFYEAMDVTVNFRKAGVMSRQVNKVVPFFNAGLQGADKFARFFSAEDIVGKSRGKVAAGRLGGWAAASMILASLIYALNGRDKEKQKQYSQLSNYVKNNYWCIPLGDGQYFAIPKPRELASMSSFAESVMDFTIGKNEHAFDEYYDYATDVFLPGIVSDFAQLPVHAVTDGLDSAVTEFGDRTIGSLGIIGAFHDLSANRDFLGRSIVSASLEGYEPKDQFTRATSKAAYWIGRGLNYSPQKIDYLGNQVLGYWWKIQKALFPVGEEYIDRSLGVKNTYFKDNVYSQDLVNWIYDQSEKSARKYKSSQKPKDGIRAKNDANMKQFYGNFYRISKDVPDTPGTVRPRQLVLDMINDYRSFTDHEILTPVQKAVYGVAERTNNMDLLPAVMKTEVKNEDAVIALSPITYVQYQTRYNELYWKYIEDNIDQKADDKQQASVISAAKKIAKAKASKHAALSMGVTDYDVEESKGEQWVDDGGDLSVWTDFEAARKEGKQDGAAEYLSNSNLSTEEKQALWELAGWAPSSFEKKVK